jgi:hypothetical protein
MYAGVRMLVPGYRRSERSWLSRPAAALLLVVAALSAHALPRPPQPVVKLQLADLGFPGIPAALRDSGAFMLTVHFVDNSHILLTYGLRGLVERIPNDPPDDDDRAVAALLLELPSGKVLAKTRWHLHDHGQYLWNAGNGRFLLRNRSTLTAIAPLANLTSADPFRQMPFAHPPGRLSAVVVSPEHDLVTVEYAPIDDRLDHEVLLETFSFLRIAGTGAPDSPIYAQSAGSVKARGAGGLPLNGRGYLFAESGKRNRWKIQFEGFGGESRTLSDVESSCPPGMQFVSPGQFVVFSCRGSMDNITLSAFDFAPHEMWEESMSGLVPVDQFAYAQQAGRFALSRTDSPVNSAAIAGLTPAVQTSSTSQEIRVYQVESGDLLLKLPCSPLARVGQNFDLSADGLNFVILHDGVIELYRLPPLTEQDKKDLAELKQYEPPPTSGPVQLRRITRAAIEAAAVSEETQEGEKRHATPIPPAPAATASSTPAPAKIPDNAPANAGDVETRRKPPSLLNPGESPDFGKKSPNE